MFEISHIHYRTNNIQILKSSSSHHLVRIAIKIALVIVFISVLTTRTPESNSCTGFIICNNPCPTYPAWLSTFSKYPIAYISIYCLSRIYPYSMVLSFLHSDIQSLVRLEFVVRTSSFLLVSRSLAVSNGYNLDSNNISDLVPYYQFLPQKFDPIVNLLSDGSLLASL